MDSITVPGTDLRTSRLVLGTMTFGDTTDRDTAARMLDIASDAGITMLDTANGYAGGATEEILGALLAARRDRFQLASKVGIPHPDAQDAPPLSAVAIRRCLDGTLRRLRADRVDVYYLHQPDRRTPIGETLDALAELTAEGKIGHVGVSNFAAWQIAELRAEASGRGAPAPVLSQPLYNLLSRRIEEEYTEFAARAGLVNVVYNPLGGGLLTGRHRFDRPPEDGRFGDSGLASMYRERYWNERLFEAVGDLSAGAAEAGLSLPELAFRWLLSRPAVGAVLVGSSKPGHLQANIAAAQGGPLDDDLLALCDSVWDRLRGPAPAYNR